MSKSSNRRPNNDILKEYIDIYINNDEKSKLMTDELEIRFGTNWHNPITKIDFDNVIEKLKSLGWNSGMGKYHMNIQSQVVSLQTGKTVMGNIRTEINGMHKIEEYCKTNTISLDDYGISYLQKMGKIYKKGRPEERRLPPINYNDFEFRVNYKTEKKLLEKFDVVKSMVRNWKNSKKVFRLIKRFTLYNRNYPFKIDCSVVKSSKKNRNRLIPEYNIEKSDVFNNPATYEIEIELIHGEAKIIGADLCLLKIRDGFKQILSGLQKTNFPTSYKLQNDIGKEYLRLVNSDNPEADIDRRLRTRDFIGPSSISLELTNIVPPDNESTVPNINMPYTVTEKADGIRKLLFIDGSGKIWLIDVNMNIQFTGTQIKEEDFYGTILDGEHVLHNKDGIFINNYLVFDLYYIGGEDYRGYPLLKIENLKYDNPEMDTTKFRYNTLTKLLKEINIISVTANSTDFRVKAKTFYTNEKGSIFRQCKHILDGVHDGTMFEYETDGLIFTPINKSVGSDLLGEWLPASKRTWRWVMKWKPPEYNTVDFLVTTKKNKAGKDMIGNIFQNGNDLSDVKQITQYKTLELRVGYSERDHGYINPCQDIIDDNLTEFTSNRDDSRRYKPVKFQPIDPTPNYDAYTCNITLQKDYESSQMTTENKLETFSDETIVEFRFNPERPIHWQWIPIRVRHDKTADYKKGLPNFGNAFHVAQSVWRSIHNPITKEMLSTGEDIPSEMVDESVYYNSKDTTVTKSLRNFHNLYVKRKLILGASLRGGTLIDLAVGKAGDLPKWIASKQSFVFGVDISPDNIDNRKDGACSRYLNSRKKFRSVPKALFVIGDSSMNIRSGEGVTTEKGRQITNAVFGTGTKDADKLGKGVYNQYGVGSEGFDVVSTQFAMHYFFETHNTLQNFVRNICEVCKVNGHFIGTCYDGLRVFRALESKAQGEKIVLMEGRQKMWEITKRYDRDTFNNDSTSLGYEIDVFQESINKTFTEYLVNFDYFIRVMENYGFVPISKEEANDMRMPNGIGSFEELHNMMNTEIKQKRLRASNVGDAQKMSFNEKKVSFLNNYFIFKKVRDVNAEAVYKTSIGSEFESQQVILAAQEMDQQVVEPEAESETKRDNKSDKSKKQRRTKKRRKKLKIIKPNTK